MPAQDSQDYDPLYKIKPVIDHFAHVFKRHFHPSQNIAIDESTVGFRGRTPHLRQYMPQKRHARFGVKLWCLCDTETGYTHAFEVYMGVRQEDSSGEGFTYNLVMCLMRQADLLYQGYHLGLDNYFTSPQLFQDLYNMKTTATGTVRKSRKGLPKNCVNASLANQKVCERRKRPLLCVAFKDGINQPIFLSTISKGGYSDYTNSRGKVETKPNVIDYNKCKGGVDLKDSKLYKYLAERRTVKWTTKVAFALFGTAVLNSYILYIKHTSSQNRMPRKHYMLSIIEALVEDYRPKRPSHKRRSNAEIAASREARIEPPSHEIAVPEDVHELHKLPKSKLRMCVAGHERRVRSTWECQKCDVGLCAACFASYHKKKTE
ncbi:piggyBac transposable element-derived protein 4-like [Macrobrachium nipponense]|uniref:piggyBac transposable element-derived protein 4-like n=1 Tax=Macrobrachium nipponense TaxID=159736 RepID=UPI0030C8BC06